MKRAFAIATGQPSSSQNQQEEISNPYKGTGLEDVYRNFLIQREYSAMLLGTPFEGSPCLPGCDILIKVPWIFHRHAKRKHQEQLQPITELPDPFHELSHDSENQQSTTEESNLMDVDNADYDTNEQIPIADSDADEDEQESDLDDYELDDDFGLEDTELTLSVRQSSPEGFGLNRFFNDLYFGSFSQAQIATAFKNFDLLLEKRFMLNIPFAHLSQLAIDFMNIKYDLDDDPEEDPLLEKIKHFAKSRPIQDYYLSKKGRRTSAEVVKLGEYSYYYVSLIEQLQDLLKNPSVIQSIEEEKTMPMVSEFFQYTSELTSDRRNYLIGKPRIEIGADDFCVVKAIGPRATYQKYLAVYFSLTNIPLKYRSKREDIRILIIADRRKMKVAGLKINDILKRLSEDMKIAMRDGIDVEITQNGHLTKRKMRIAFSGLLGDNKGTYEILGLSESFGRYFVCRACMAKRSEIETKLNFKVKGNLGDVQEYKRKVALLGQEKNDWGIKCQYVFAINNDINIFNSAPFDVLHDLPQGVIPRLLPFILWFGGATNSFKNLLRQIEEFELYHGYVTFNTEHQIKGTAVQKVELIARLSQIIDFNRQSEGFQLYSILRQFTQLAFSNTLTEEERLNLNALSRALVSLTKELDKVHTFKVTPKLHNLLHYGDYVKLFGPLALRSTLPLERKHKFCTDWAKVMNCFKNPAFSFIDRHQSFLVIRTANYSKRNFFPNDGDASLLDNLPIGFRKLVARQAEQSIPHKTKKGIMRSFSLGGVTHWISTTKFWINSDNDILSEGIVFKHLIEKNHHLGLVLEQCYNEPKFIFMKYLSHVNDFYVQKCGINILISGIL